MKLSQIRYLLPKGRYVIYERPLNAMEHSQLIHHTVIVITLILAQSDHIENNEQIS